MRDTRRGMAVCVSHTSVNARDKRDDKRLHSASLAVNAWTPRCRLKVRVVRVAFMPIIIFIVCCH